MKEITDMYPNAPLIKRQGEINAWDNADFRDAVKATGRKQLVIAGILTDVCKKTPASFVDNDYYVNILKAPLSLGSHFALKATACGPTSKHRERQPSWFAILQT